MFQSVFLLQASSTNTIQASILACTRSRFQQKKIYTGMGQVLMAVNPFELIPNIYGKEVIRRSQVLSLSIHT